MDSTIRKYLISIVIPCYNEMDNIYPLYEQIVNIFLEKDTIKEIIFVDDGSSDNTLHIIKELRRLDKRVHYISFSRNFGKEAALLAGLENATGDYAVIMDADLQDPPSLIPKMYEICTKENYDCVATRRTSRNGESIIRSFFSKMFYWIINKLSSIEIVDGARDFRIMSSKMVRAVISDREYNRFSKGLYVWVGFKTKWIEYENVIRSSGQSKWSFWQLVKYALEGILAYSIVPLTMSFFMGSIICLLSFAGFLFLMFRVIINDYSINRWLSVISIMLFLAGIILINLGIIGLYLSKIYLETKKRQIYIINEQE